MKPVIYICLLLAASLDLTTARPVKLSFKHRHGAMKQRFSFWNTKLGRREVPQEHSHEKFIILVNTNLKLNNPDQIQDAIFGLLGNAAGSAGQGDITDTDCLQQATADQAFTNAKNGGDVDGMTAALIYRALERNTNTVGLASVSCTSVKAVNPEIAAVSQHQDPASDNAATVNKDITLALAVQIANMGGNPLDALQSGTFPPGEIGDLTGKGRTCDDANDPIGCIYTQNLLVEDASEDEINAAVAASATASGVAAATATDALPTECPADPEADDSAATNTSTTAEATVTTATVTVTATGKTPTTAASKSTTTATATKSSSNTATTAEPTQTVAASNNINTNTGSPTLDFGSCSNPTIIFANDLDGRNEASFAPADESIFTHGSALTIQVISNFICGQLGSKCQASNAAVRACNQGAVAAQGANGQAAADAFNQALGF